MKKKHYREIRISPTGIPTWSEGAFTIAFMYSQKHGNFVVKGYMKEVKQYLKENVTGHYFGWFTLWSDGKHRTILYTDTDVKGLCYDCGWHIYSPSFYQPDGRYRKVLERTKYHIINKITGKEMELKRIPKKWIPEFTELFH